MLVPALPEREGEYLSVWDISVCADVAACGVAAELVREIDERDARVE
jgi:hypothetical protein